MFRSRELSRSTRLGSYRIGLRLERVGLCLIILLIGLLLAACGEEPSPNNSDLDPAVEPTETAAAKTLPSPTVELPSEEQEIPEENPKDVVDLEIIAEATGTPKVEKQIVLCLGGPPVSLYPYGDDTTAALGLRQALYESLYTTTGYDYQARGLEKIPSLADGDAVIRKVLAEEGDLVSDVGGNVVRLVNDVTVLNSDGEAIRFDGTPVEMSQMVVDFIFQPMVWSDGTTVTVQDSIFSFNLASDPNTDTKKSLLANTASYEAAGEYSVRWTGIPGYMDQSYFLNVWLPLPSHQLAGKTAAELKSAEETTRIPLSSGPYVVTDWTEDGNLILARNEQYYRQADDLPVIDRIIVRFGNGEEFLAGNSATGCDVIANGAMHAGNLPLLEIASETDDWEVMTSPGSVFEHIAFGINPIKEYAGRRPDWFEDRRVRQAMTMCTDRQRMVEELTDGRAELLNAYVPADHRLYPDDLTTWSYDPAQANMLLDEAGYLDYSEDGWRQDVTSGIPMTITLGTNSESSLRVNITKIFQENMADCGIPVEIQDFPAGTWFAEGPVGRVFGRHYDLAEFAWLGKSLPDCGLYLGRNITGPVEAGFGGWQNTNVTGWSNEEYDAACLAALDIMPGGAGYGENQKEALRIFAQELPAIPLFTNIKVAAVRPWIKNVKLDPSQPSLLWNIYEWDIEQ